MDAEKSLRRWVLALLILGLAWRSLRYALQFPIWGDEAMLCLNFVDQDYEGLAQPLKHGQVAPILFLWTELTSYFLLGPSELALRLLPFLAGAVALLLFWRLCRATLDPLPAALAVGLLAISYYPVRHACEVKPYSFDLLAAVGVMLPAVAWLKEPANKRPLALLAAITPLAIAGSYPAVFVAASISVVLTPTVLRARHAMTTALFAIYNALIAASFLATYFLVGGQQVADEPLHQFLQDYWHDWMPAHDPVSLLKWLGLAHTGNMFAYPFGGPNGASTLTFLLCLAGIRTLWTSNQRTTLAVCVLPFAFSMLAALIHKYPYGGSARLAQHLAPAICMLAGAGLASVIALPCPKGEVRPRWLVPSFVMLLLIGAVGLGRDLVQPFKTQGEIMARSIIADLRARASADDAIVVLNPLADLKATFQWYLSEERNRIVDARSPSAERVWCLRFWDPLPPSEIANRLGPAWVLYEEEQHAIPGDRRHDPIERVQITCWVRREPIQ